MSGQDDPCGKYDVNYAIGMVADVVNSSVKFSQEVSALEGVSVKTSEAHHEAVLILLGALTGREISEYSVAAASYQTGKETD